MLGNLPGPTRLLWHTVGKRSCQRKIRRIAADLRYSGRALPRQLQPEGTVAGCCPSKA